MTDRELQVAILVAEGLTDKEIGATLGISENTVGVHLTHIAKRLEITSGNTRVLVTRHVMLLKNADGEYLWTNWPRRASLHAEMSAA